MKHYRALLTLLFAGILFPLLSLSPSTSLPANAQGPQPTLPAPRSQNSELAQTVEPEEATSSEYASLGRFAPPDPRRIPSAAASTGGPDDFGYTWDDSVPYAWIDATGGTDSGLQGIDAFVGPINLGFDFRFYENTYSQLYISSEGMITFGSGSTVWQNQPIPLAGFPNNFIAPFWDDLTVASPYNSGKVYYQSGGTAPNRYTVVEWYNVTSCCSIPGSDYKTFEAILHENGDIVFQYQSLSGYLRSATVGIEDSYGTIGLQYLYNASGLSNNKAIRFYRPAASARAGITPLAQGRFASSSSTQSFQVGIRNMGDLGPDTFNLTSSSGWPITLYASDGVTPISNTGSVAQAGVYMAIAKIAVPSTATMGANATAVVTATSTLDPTKQKATTLQVAIPTRFAQAYTDTSAGTYLYLAQPESEVAYQLVNSAKSNLALSEARAGQLVYAWNNFRCASGSPCIAYVREIEYEILDRSGSVIRPANKLVDHSGVTTDTYDYNPVLAVAPNGAIGIAWYRYLYNRASSEYNYNIYFALLNPAGDLVYGPANLTNNGLWGNSSSLDIPSSYGVHVAALGDNRFALAWSRSYQASGGYVSDIVYAVRDSTGAQVVAPTLLTSDTPGNSGFYAPVITALVPNRFLVAYQNYSGSNAEIYYAVLASDGTSVKAPAALTPWDDGFYEASPQDAAQLSDGKTIVGWMAYGCPGPWTSRIRYAILDASYKLVGSPSCVGAAPTVSLGDTALSIAPDTLGNAVFTWLNGSSPTDLYYALVNTNGTIVTPPLSFRKTQNPSASISTSYLGYGNTTYSVPGLFLPLLLR